MATDAPFVDMDCPMSAVSGRQTIEAPYLELAEFLWGIFTVKFEKISESEDGECVTAYSSALHVD